MADSRLLRESTSFADTADEWALGRGIIDVNGDPTSRFPQIIGMPDGSPDLGAFNIGIITNNRTIKQALQDLETEVSTRMLSSDNLSDLDSIPTARDNLGLGSAAIQSIGTSGDAVPLLNTINIWSEKQTFNKGVAATQVVEITNTPGSTASLSLLSGTSLRWMISKDNGVESGTNAGSNFSIARYSDTGVLIDSPLSINRSTGIITLSKALPAASGGTGVTSLAALKTSLALDNVNNTSDVNKPISTAVQTALNGKQASLGFTPIQQSGGAGQGSNKVYIGWSGSRLKAQVDTTDLGNVVFDNHLTKAAVGLSNVDNTSDVNKPISTAVQTALDARFAVAGDTITGLLTMSRNSGEQIRLGYNTASVLDPYISFFQTGTTRSGYIQSHRTSGLLFKNDASAYSLNLNNDGSITYGGYEIWHAGSDGAGSGLDSDLLDGQQGAYYRDLGNSTGTLPNARVSGSYDGIDTLTVNRIRCLSTSDVSLTSTAHGFQVGNAGAEHIIADGNEIQARNGTSAANLNLNLSGGAVACGGALTATSITASGEITAFSDARLKSDIRTIDDALEIVKNLRGVRYVKDEKESVGVIAQEVQTVLPELVMENENGLLSVAYGNIVSVLIEAVKTLDAEVQALKAAK